MCVCVRAVAPSCPAWPGAEPEGCAQRGRLGLHPGVWHPAAGAGSARPRPRPAPGPRGALERETLGPPAHPCPAMDARAGKGHSPRGLGDVQEAGAWAPALSRGPSLPWSPACHAWHPSAGREPLPSCPASPSGDAHVTLRHRRRPLLTCPREPRRAGPSWARGWRPTWTRLLKVTLLGRRTPTSIWAHIQQSILSFGAWSTGGPAAGPSGWGVRGRAPRQADGVPCEGELTRGGSPEALQLWRGCAQQGLPEAAGQELGCHTAGRGRAEAASLPRAAGSLGAGSAAGRSRLVVAAGDGSGLQAPGACPHASGTAGRSPGTDARASPCLGGAAVSSLWHRTVHGPPGRAGPAPPSPSSLAASRRPGCLSPSGHVLGKAGPQGREQGAAARWGREAVCVAPGLSYLHGKQESTKGDLG